MSYTNIFKSKFSRSTVLFVCNKSLFYIIIFKHFTPLPAHTVFIRIKAGLKYMQGLKYTPGSAAE